MQTNSIDIGNPFGYKALTLDDESGLYIDGTKMYDPRIGRYAQRVHNHETDANLYTFQENNPIK